MTGNNKKIEFALIFCVPLLFLLGLGLYLVAGSSNDKLSVLEFNWNIDLPQPLKIIDIASNISGLPADGIA